MSAQRRRRTFGPHRGPVWEARRGARTITFRPWQIVGGRRWSLALVTVDPPGWVDFKSEVLRRRGEDA